MIKYMIHTTPEREWYVKGYLVPSMTSQGIKKGEIRIWKDGRKKGNLRAFLGSMEWIAQTQEKYEAIWHLQDDVIISKDFKEITSRPYDGVVCGFCSEEYDHYTQGGHTVVGNMWYSFQCIRIPNYMAEGLVKFVITADDPTIQAIVESGKDDDLLFKEYMRRQWAGASVCHLVPNIVDHIDYLIGGSIINKARNKQTRARYWQDEVLVKELEERLHEKDA